MPNPWKWLDEEPHHRRGLRILQALIGVSMLIRIVAEAPFASYLWGPRGLGYGSEVHGRGLRGAALDAVFATEGSTRGFLLVLATCAVALVAGYNARWVVGLSACAYTLWTSRLEDLADGGDNIAQLVLLYMLLVLPGRGQPSARSLRIWFHNLGVVLITGQILLLYLTAGLMKGRGEVWHQGTAMYLLSQVEAFSLPSLRPLFQYSWVTTVASYATILFQVWFPVAMFSRLKLPWLLMGIGFHIGIGAFMGLISFSVTMIGVDLFLVTDDEYTRVGDGLARLARRFQPQRWCAGRA